MIKLTSHKDLLVFQKSFDVGMEIFEITKSFPKAEIYALTDQIRRSSRSVSGQIAEGFRKRKYPKSFISKLIDAEAEAAETQVWLDYAKECQYISHKQYENLYSHYEQIISMLVVMRNNPDKWSL